MTDLSLNKELLQGLCAEIRPGTHKQEQDDPFTPISESLEDRIKDMVKHGATLELIVLAIMTNDSGNGAMDVCSLSIADIAKIANELSDVQDDLINLQRILSKIEAELGSKKDISPDDWNKFDKSLLKQLKDTYEKLCKDQKTLAESKDPKVKVVADAIANFIKDLNASVPTPSGSTGTLSPFDELIKNWDGNTDFPVGKYLANNLCGAVFALAKNFYDKNHASSGDSNTDYLGQWTSSVNADEQLTSGTSQQETTAVQAYQQMLNSYNNIGQQSIQTTSQGKGSMVRNQRAG